MYPRVYTTTTGINFLDIWLFLLFLYLIPLNFLFIRSPPFRSLKVPCFILPLPLLFQFSKYLLVISFFYLLINYSLYYPLNQIWINSLSCFIGNVFFRSLNFSRITTATIEPPNAENNPRTPIVMLKASASS